jgi:hypothetical protein
MSLGVAMVELEMMMAESDAISWSSNSSIVEMDRIRCSITSKITALM